MKIQLRTIGTLSKISLFGAIGLIFAAMPARAEKYISGTYTCVSAEVGGKVRHCKAPSLEMSDDGSYTFLEEHGTYEILKGQWLVLSSSKNHRRARLEGKKIIFEFLSGGQKSTITYRRKFQRPPAWVSG
jgi:hypothetical protein